ncbi:hypothetical protein ACI65C_005453 [Semiaphis heraclei]
MDTDDLMNVERIFQFSIGQNVLAYDDGLLYNAKIMKRHRTVDGAHEYCVHYTRFKTKWDKWLIEDEVLVENSINLAHKQRLESNRKNCRKGAKKSQDPWTSEGAPSEPAENALSMPVPRKRGRPKKIIKPTAEPAENALSMPVPRKRGRPKKIIKPTAEPAENALSMPVPRKREIIFVKENPRVQFIVQQIEINFYSSHIRAEKVNKTKKIILKTILSPEDCSGPPVNMNELSNGNLMLRLKEYFSD